MRDFKTIVKYVAVICFVLFSFSAGRTLQSRKARIDLQAALAERDIALKEIKQTQNKNASLKKSLTSAEESNEELLDLVASLRARPPEVKYITKVETVIVSEPTLVTTELPNSHTFRMKNGLPVAEFTVADGPTYSFNTADLAVTADLVITEDSSAVSLRMASDLEPDSEYEIKVDKLNVTNTEEKRIFEPHITLGGHVSANPVGFGTGPQLGVSFVHLRDDIDLVHAGVGITNGRANVRFEPFSYNVGKPIPVLTSLWLGAGVEINALGQLSGSLSLSGKL